ncbi:MAG TPA: helix-turn-helix transcriptional regulator [Pirellulales bacterium]
MPDVQHLMIDGKRFVILPELEYEAICREAGRAPAAGGPDDWPELPKPDERGHVPAVEYSRVSIARDLISQRRAVGLTQQELADAAGVRQETISRIESGKHSVTVKTYDKIFAALDSARKRRHRKVR